ncbi:hypothetical protein [Sphingomonas sp. SAFR-052]|uniref:hypothetical protein n=1 Tax=Sphingomonas sp. SAFR-052 TaxID=3436867 RepID=UPI003F7CD8CC
MNGSSIVGGVELRDAEEREEEQPLHINVAESREAFNNTVMAIANAPIRVSRTGERLRTLPLFEVLVRRLATGQTSRRVSALPFIRLAIQCAESRAATPGEASVTHDGSVAAPHPGDPFGQVLRSDSDADIEQLIATVLGITDAATPPAQV